MNPNQNDERVDNVNGEDNILGGPNNAEREANPGVREAEANANAKKYSNEIPLGSAGCGSWFDDIVVKSVYGNQPRELFRNDKFRSIKKPKFALPEWEEKESKFKTPPSCRVWVNLNQLAHLQVEKQRNSLRFVIARCTPTNQIRCYRNDCDDPTKPTSVCRFVCVFPKGNFTIDIHVSGRITKKQYHTVPLKPSNWDYPERQGYSVETFIANFASAGVHGEMVTQTLMFRVVGVSIVGKSSEG